MLAEGQSGRRIQSRVHRGTVTRTIRQRRHTHIQRAIGSSTPSPRRRRCEPCLVLILFSIDCPSAPGTRSEGKAERWRRWQNMDSHSADSRRQRAGARVCLPIGAEQSAVAPAGTVKLQVDSPSTLYPTLTLWYCAPREPCLRLFATAKAAATVASRWGSSLFSLVVPVPPTMVEAEWRTTEQGEGGYLPALTCLVATLSRQRTHKVASFSISRKWHHWCWQHPASCRCRFVAVLASVGTLITRNDMRRDRRRTLLAFLVSSTEGSS
jgi:hypothetical protein